MTTRSWPPSASANCYPRRERDPALPPRRRQRRAIAPRLRSRTSRRPHPRGQAPAGAAGQGHPVRSRMESVREATSRRPQATRPPDLAPHTRQPTRPETQAQPNPGLPAAMGRRPDRKRGRGGAIPDDVHVVGRNPAPTQGEHVIWHRTRYDPPEASKVGLVLACGPRGGLYVVRAQLVRRYPGRHPWWAEIPALPQEE
jgi:hypothetical protein